MVEPNWNLSFELLCDVSDDVVRAVLGQRKYKHFLLIYYASKTLTSDQENYTYAQKELLTVIFVVDKIKQYLILSRGVAFTNQLVLCYLMNKADAKQKLIRLVLLLQEFNMEIKDKDGAKSVAADHLSQLGGTSLAATTWVVK